MGTRPDDDDLVFFTNGRGGVAISVDGGVHLQIANGKLMAARHTAWEVADEDEDELEDKLSPQQKLVLKMYRFRPEPTGVDAIVQTYSKGRRRESKHLPGEQRRTKVPEGAQVVMSEKD